MGKKRYLCCSRTYNYPMMNLKKLLMILILINYISKCISSIDKVSCLDKHKKEKKKKKIIKEDKTIITNSKKCTDLVVKIPLIINKSASYMPFYKSINISADEIYLANVDNEIKLKDLIIVPSKEKNKLNLFFNGILKTDIEYSTDNSLRNMIFYDEFKFNTEIECHRDYIDYRNITYDLDSVKIFKNIKVDKGIDGGNWQIGLAICAKIFICLKEEQYINIKEATND